MCSYKVHMCSYKVLVILFRFLLNLNFLYGFSKSTPMSNFVKIRPVVAGLFHADAQRDGQT